MPLTASTVFSTALDCRTTAPTTYYSCHSLLSSAKHEHEHEHGAELAENYWSEVTPTIQDWVEPVSLSTRKLEWSLVYRSQGYRLEEYLEICEANSLEKTVISQQHYDARRADWGDEDAVWREYRHGYIRRPAKGWIGRESPVYGLTSVDAVNDDGSRLVPSYRNVLLYGKQKEWPGWAPRAQQPQSPTPASLSPIQLASGALLTVLARSLHVIYALHVLSHDVVHSETKNLYAILFLASSIRKLSAAFPASSRFAAYIGRLIAYWDLVREPGHKYEYEEREEEEVYLGIADFEPEWD